MQLLVTLNWLDHWVQAFSYDVKASGAAYLLCFLMGSYLLRQITMEVPVLSTPYTPTIPFQSAPSGEVFLNCALYRKQTKTSTIMI